MEAKEELERPNFISVGKTSSKDSWSDVDLRTVVKWRQQESLTGASLQKRGEGGWFRERWKRREEMVEGVGIGEGGRNRWDRGDRRGGRRR